MAYVNVKDHKMSKANYVSCYAMSYDDFMVYI